MARISENSEINNDTEHVAGALPDFIIIGAMKAGSTELFRILSKHPQIHRCKHKEPNFFVSEKLGSGRGTWRKGIGWYKSLFPAGDGIRGEASVRYTNCQGYAGVPDMIHKVLPNAKFIYLVREPVDRAISQFLYGTLKGNEHRSIQEALAPSSSTGYVAVGRYYMQLSAYLCRFPRERFQIVCSEELWKQPHEVLDKVFQFLQVRPMTVDLGQLKQTNSIRSVIERLIQGQMPITTQRQAGILELVKDMPLDDWRSGEIALRMGFGATDMASLRSCFDEDISRLEGFVGRRFELWHNKSTL